MKKLIGVLLGVMLVVATIAGCSAKEENTGSDTAQGFDTSKDISVVSREEGSGTRGAFIELFGIEKKNDSGEKVDYTYEEAEITNNTSVMMTTVSGDLYAIGYISLGSLNDTVKALQIGGAAATTENINNGSYKIARPFNIATKGTVSEVAQDFINFILSADGQKVVEDNKYISVGDKPAFTSTKKSGKVVVAGSSSVSPVMEKLKEAYLKINTNATIEIQTSDSTTGMTSVKDGICDIGMASREVKDSEISAGLKATVIAKDGIAVIVNKGNVVNGLTSEQVASIFTGETTTWSDVIS